MIGDAKEERDLPVLQLHNWANFPLAISHFSEAALSPSRNKLLLLSRHGEALVVPLGSVSDDSRNTPNVYRRLGSCSSTCSSAWTSSTASTNGAFPGLRCPSSFSVLLDNECFSWACSGEEYGANQSTGPFRELLLTAGKEGLIIHAFCNKSDVVNKTEDVVGQCMEDNRQSHPCSNRFSGSNLEDKSSGSWRNWGKGESNRRRELWRRLKEQFFSNQGKNDESPQVCEQEMRSSDSINAKGSEGVRRSKSSQGATRNSYSSEVRGIGCEECMGFESFAVNANIEGNDREASLVFEKNHSWPLSAEVISFRLVHGSDAILRLVSLSQKTRVAGQTHGYASSVHKSDEVPSRVSSSGWTRLKNGYFSTLRKPEGRHEVSGIISSPSQSLVAILFSTFPPCKSGASTSAESNHGDWSYEGLSNKRWKKRWEGSSDLRIITATVHSWGLKWATGIDFECARKDSRMSLNQWADFKMTTDKFLGLTKSGSVHLWTATTGIYIACIDAFQFRQTTFRRKVISSVELNNCAKSAFHDTSKEVPEVVLAEIEKEANPGSGVASASCLHPAQKQGFVQLMVTADCMLIAISNYQGLVYLLSVGETILANLQPSYTDFVSSEKYNRFQAFSNWEVAGLSIDGAAPIEEPSEHEMKARLSSLGQMRSMTTERADTTISSSEHHIVHSASLGSSGFTSRLGYGGKILTCTVQNSPKLLRNMLFPLTPNDSFVGMALNPYSITRLIVNDKNRSKITIVQSKLRITGGPFDDVTLSNRELLALQERIFKEHRYEGEVLSFASQGCLYLVTATALHVVLPPLALSSSKSGPMVGHEYSRWRSILRNKMFSNIRDGMLPLLTRSHAKQWQAEVQDRALIFDGLEETERLCIENGWSLHYLRLRRLQLALDYLQIDKIERALEGLVVVGAAEAGMPLVLFAAVKLMLTPFGTDNELVLASRLISIGAQFATRLVRRHNMACSRLQRRNTTQNFMSSSLSIIQQMQSSSRFPHGVTELARFIFVIRSLEEHLQAKRKGRHRSFKMTRQTLFASNSRSSKNKPIVEFPKEPGSVDLNDSENQNKHAKRLTSASDGSYLPISHGTLVTAAGSLRAMTGSDEGALAGGKRRRFVESADEMLARWETTSMDAESVVKDALIAGRIPAAVVQLHRMHSKALINCSQGSQPRIVDAFKEVQEISKGVVYRLLCKGKMALALAALRRLGEDIETVLYQMAFGTVRRNLRKQTTKELLRHVCLGTVDSRLLEITAHLEGLYPSGSFWTSYAAQHGQIKRNYPIINMFALDDENQSLQMICTSKAGETFILKCGDGDGVVLGFWNTAKDVDATENTGLGRHNTGTGYFSVATIWLHAWNQRTVDRVVLDRLHATNDHTGWESLLEYCVAHQNWPAVSDLLDDIPSTVLSSGVLRVLPMNHIGSLHTCSHLPLGRTSQQDVILPKVNYLNLSSLPLCSGMMLRMMEEKLAKSLIFLRLYWGRITLLSLLAAAGVLFMPIYKGRMANCKELILARSMVGKEFCPFNFHREAMQGVHELVVRHCLENSLPHLFERYLTFQSLGSKKTSAVLFESYMGNFEWARWQLLSRLKGHEFEASFANFNSISNFNGGKYMTVDDMAAAGQGLPALATLMYASVPLQKCLSVGNRMDEQKWQCSLDNLREVLQDYPTFLRTLESLSPGHDSWGFYAIRSTNAGETSQDMSGYLKWRGTLSSCVAGDAHLLHILPCWVPKSVRKLLLLAIQGPGGVSAGTIKQGGNFSARNLSAGNVRNNDQEFGAELHEEGALQWEYRLQAVVKQELYAPVPEEIEPGVVHYLRRGCALAAYNTLLGSRGHFTGTQLEKSEKSSALLESSILLESLTENEKVLIASIYPFALSNFENTTIAAACSLFLELCGVSAQLLRVDIAALQRISKHIKAKEQREWAASTGTNRSRDRPSSMFSLVKALADDFGTNIITSFGTHSSKTKSNTGLASTLQLLEEATLMECGSKTGMGASSSWLLNAAGNGDNSREVQRPSSEHWSLVTAFCRGHELPLSTTYLVTLARDNVWVGFLAEAQAMGCPLDVLLDLASNEITNPRLKYHILTALKSLLTSTKLKIPDSQDASNLVFNSTTAEELFRLLAECEGERCPGAKLLAKSKELQWSLLAVLASCFDDIKPVSCLFMWLKIIAAREVSSKISSSKAVEQLAATVGAAVESTKTEVNHRPLVSFDRSNPKRQRCHPRDTGPVENKEDFFQEDAVKARTYSTKAPGLKALDAKVAGDEAFTEDSLSELVAFLCEQQMFLPLLQAFELFAPKSPILPFIRFLQAFAQMRLSEASTELITFSALLKQEKNNSVKNTLSWISRIAVTAAESMLKACPSVYERHCLLRLLSAVDFCDNGIASLKFKRYCWKLQLAEPSLCVRKETVAHGPNLDDYELLESLEASGLWDEGRMWAQQLDLKAQRTSSALHLVTENQAEAMVAEWKELLWDMQTERAPLWSHCQALFVRHSLPPLQAGTFFLKHADAAEGGVSTLELHGILLLAFQWLSGSLTNTSPVYPIHLLHELEVRIWLLAAEAEVEMRNGQDQDLMDFSVGRNAAASSSISPVDITAETVALVDLHMKKMSLMSRTENPSDRRDTALRRRGHSSSPHKIRRNLKFSKYASVTIDSRETAMNSRAIDNSDESFSPSTLGRTRSLKVTKGERSNVPSIGSSKEPVSLDPYEALESSAIPQQVGGIQKGIQSGNCEEPIDEEEQVERAVLALVEVGQVEVAKQLQQKLSPGYVPLELLLVEDAKKIANLSEPDSDVSSILHPRVFEALSATNSVTTSLSGPPTQVLNTLVEVCPEGCGRGLCQRIAAIAQVSNFLGLQFMEAFEEPPVQLLQLLSLKGHDALHEATVLVATQSMAAPAIARVLSETFYKGLAAAYHLGYLEMTEVDDGLGPLLWRVSEFKQWAKLCPTESEIGHALMRIIISARDLPHYCEVDLLILTYEYYASSKCLDGLDVLVGFISTRADAYDAEADFASLTRLVIGLRSLPALRFILDILVENKQLELLLQKTMWLDVVDADRSSKCAIQGLHVGILSSLNHFSNFDEDALAMVYNEFKMTYEKAGWLKARAEKGVEWCVKHPDLELSEDLLLDTMHLLVEAAECYSTIDAGFSTSWCCAQASMISLQLRLPELTWLKLTETNARRLLVEQPRFAEALIVADAYNLNQSAEWVPVLWNQMLQSNRIDQFLSDFVAVLPIPAVMLMELARYYRAEKHARGYQMDFTKWLTPGAVPMELSMRSLLKHVLDVRVRVRLATIATGFPDIVDWCMQLLDRVPENAGPLVLRRGHGGAYIPLM